MAPARVDAGDMVKRWPDAGCILKEELTGLADVLHVGEKETRMNPSLDAWKNGVVSLPKWVKMWEGSFKQGNQEFVFGLVRSKMPFRHPRGDVKEVVVDKSLDFRERSRLEL